MMRKSIAVFGLLLAAGMGGCRRQGQAPPVTSVSGPLYTWPSNARTVPAGTLVVIRTFRAISVANPTDQRIYPALVARDIPNSSGTPMIFGGSPASIAVLRNPAGGFRLGLHSVVAGGNTYLATSTAEGDNVQPGRVRRGAPLGTLVDEVPAEESTLEAGQTVAVEGPRIFVPGDMLLFFRLQQPIQLE